MLPVARTLSAPVRLAFIAGAWLAVAAGLTSKSTELPDPQFVQ